MSRAAMNRTLPADAERAAALERQLREHYRRQPAPAGLADAVLARAQEGSLARRGRGPSGAWGRPLLGIASALITVCALLVAVVVHQHQAEARRAQAAQAHLLYALQMTAQELNWVEDNLNQDLAEPGGQSRGGVQKP